MPKEITLEDLNATLDTAIARCEATLEDFKERLNKDPEHAFEWGTDALEASAKLRVVQECKHYANLENDSDGVPITFEQRLANLRSYFTDAAMTAAERVPSSSSSMSNLVENYRRSALAKLVSTLNGSYFGGI